MNDQLGLRGGWIRSIPHCPHWASGSAGDVFLPTFDGSAQGPLDSGAGFGGSEPFWPVVFGFRRRRADGEVTLIGGEDNFRVETSKKVGGTWFDIRITQILNRNRGGFCTES